MNSLVHISEVTANDMIHNVLQGIVTNLSLFPTMQFELSLSSEVYTFAGSSGRKRVRGNGCCCTLAVE